MEARPMKHSPILERLNSDAMERDFHDELERMFRPTVLLVCALAVILLVVLVAVIGKSLAEAAYVEVHGAALAAQHYDARVTK